MLLSDLLFGIFRFFIPPALIATTYIYWYPLLHECTFNVVKPAEAGCMIPGQERPSIPAQAAPFRLLAFADPQLEGGTSLPRPDTPWIPSFHPLGRSVRDGNYGALPADFQAGVKGLFGDDIPRWLYSVRKRIDLWGNDWYLAHIYRGVHWWSDPTHTVVLGDLLGSQWMNDTDFQRRSQRFWKRVFRRATRVSRDITDVSGRVEVLGEDKRWKRRLIAVAGNHDIGYAGDIDEHRIQRFEDAFGSVNWEMRFRLNESEAATTSSSQSSFSSPFGQSIFDTTPPELRLIVLNSMNLDGPAGKEHLQLQSREFVTDHLHTPKGDTSKNTATVFLTHIPFYKEAGICTDGPMFDYFSNGHFGHGIKEQNHLSESTSKYILDGLVSEKKKGKVVVLNGHDHEGCDTYHHRPIDPPPPPSSGEEGEQRLWSTTLSPEAFDRGMHTNDSLMGLREVTVRSMMGSFGGNVGFLTAWFDDEEQDWKFDYKSCQFWTQHVWWGVHIFDLVLLSIGFAGCVAFVKEVRREIEEDNARERERERAKKVS